MGRRREYRTRWLREPHPDAIYAAQLALFGFSDSEICKALIELRQSEGRDLADPPDMKGELIIEVIDIPPAKGGRGEGPPHRAAKKGGEQ